METQEGKDCSGVNVGNLQSLHTVGRIPQGMRRKVFQEVSQWVVVCRTLGVEDRDKPVHQATVGGSWRGRSRISTPSPGEAPQEEAWSPNGASQERREHSPITEKATSSFSCGFVFQAQSHWIPRGGPQQQNALRRLYKTH